jgi:hypothetical protein
VHDPNAGFAYLRDAVHWQRRQSRRHTRVGAFDPTRHSAKPSEDRVRTLDVCIGDGLGVRAATSVAVVLTGNLGLDVAAQGHVTRHDLIDMDKQRGLGIEPVKIAIEQKLRPRFLTTGHAPDFGQCELIAVKSADYV